MTAILDPALSARLIAEAREDDALLPPGPWTVSKDHYLSGKRYSPSVDGPTASGIVVVNDSLVEDLCSMDRLDTMDRRDAMADAFARARNNHAPLAEQLEAALSVAVRAVELLEMRAEAARTGDDLDDSWADEVDLLREVLGRMRRGGSVARET